LTFDTLTNELFTIHLYTYIHTLKVLIRLYIMAFRFNVTNLNKAGHLMNIQKVHQEFFDL